MEHFAKHWWKYAVGYFVVAYAYNNYVNPTGTKLPFDVISMVV